MTGNSRDKILIIAGEASGDLHGAGLIKHLKEMRPSLDIWAVGGERMEQSGARILISSSILSVVGLVEICSRLTSIVSSYFRIRTWLKQNRPSLLILIDFPEFNMMMARYAKSIGIKVFYYISPQIWAWRQGRVKRIRKYVDKMAVILPFEKEFYAKHGLHVEYVGHPLMDVIGDRPDCNIFLKKFGLDTDKRLISLLPGSRGAEIRTLLPIMLEAAKMLNKEFDQLSFIIPIASGLDDNVQGFIHECVKKYEQTGLRVMACEGFSHEALSCSVFAILASGTVSLEAAILGCPMVVIYRLSGLTAFLAKRLIKVQWVSLVNLIAQRHVIPELLQEKATPDEIYTIVKRYIEDDKLIEQTKHELSLVRSLLGHGGAAKKAARIALKLMDASQQ